MNSSFCLALRLLVKQTCTMYWHLLSNSQTLCDDISKITKNTPSIQVVVSSPRKGKDNADLSTMLAAIANVRDGDILTDPFIDLVSHPV